MMIISVRHRIAVSRLLVPVLACSRSHAFMLVPVALSLILFASCPAWVFASSGAIDDIRKFEAARARIVRSAVDAALPCIVTIETVGGAQPLLEGATRPTEASFRMADGPTTGIILTSDGLILSSTFNFARDPSIITVRLSDGRRLVATLLARDHIRRVALLRVEAEELPTANWAEADEIMVGQYAIACGMGLGEARPFASLGIVSAVNRRNGLAIQTDAKTSPVNYGGPLIDLEGRVLGLLVPMAGAGGGALAGVHWYDSGIGFAVTGDRIAAVVERLRRGENIEPGKIGVLLAEQEPGVLNELFEDLFPRSRGVRIAAIADPSPAKRADIQTDDVITALDGHPIGDIADLQRKLSDRAAGETVTLSIKRRWRSFEVSVVLARSSDLGPIDAPRVQPEPVPDDNIPPSDEAPAPATQPDTD